MDSWLSAPIDPALHIPKPNPFIATDFGLRHAVAASTVDDAEAINPVTASREAVLGPLAAVLAWLFTLPFLH